ncbi:uncharacterized protein LODBEIA_P16420 [Lodderomyces beijingensis]|uniref:Dit1p n=1 Tax=Lodderomyces beijingensis TaxID=1775926 RepID=A0ABP0ZGY2_9ASCO
MDSSPLASSASSNTTVDRYNPIYENICMVYSRNDHTILSERKFFPLFDIDLFAKKVHLEHNGIHQSVVGEYFVWEKQQGQTWNGVVTVQFNITEFELWFIELVLTSSKLNYEYVRGGDKVTTTQKITELFEKMLKYNVENDKWDAIGKLKFSKSVEFFTSHGQPVEAVLPAFPCKSSNQEKVYGTMPDKGEELALQRLIKFAREVKKIYPPGFIMWIVSDGHVFSDCIAVDDSVVNEYSAALKKLYRSICDDDDCIRFRSLPEIFKLTRSFNCSMVDHVELGHYLDTEIDPESEICRKILMNSCDTDNGKLYMEVHTPGHPRLSLFRGFSKFMVEDLQFHPTVRNISRKKLKKIASQVAFEMIKRNDAYSNLVELMFPFHLRFSIHAHNNAGPKFGISLLRGQCSPINSIQDHKEPQHIDLLHIPTPWHNSVVKIDDQYFAVKAKKIVEEVDKGNGFGHWDNINLHYIYIAKQ